MSEINAELLDAGPFTPREAEIVPLMCQGDPNKVIAAKLAISIRTVDAHINTMYEKLGLRNRSINTRCTAILTMVARGMVALSIKVVVLILIFNSAQLDGSALRVRAARGRAGVSQTRRADDA